MGKHITPEVEANARLIAAAPDLLGALNDVLAQTPWHSLNSESLEKAKQAINKAEGNQ